jgi:asparagine synthase (glutamine-hydrolysing)
MGAIYGAFGGREPLAPEVLARMSSLLAHRGRDEGGAHTSEGAALGARPGEGSAPQPFTSSDGLLACVCDGNVYNAPELRRELGLDGNGADRAGRDVILPLYERAPDDFERRLRGSFAIAIWDGRRRRGVLVRDRLGVKPLYYAASDGRTVFGSELKSVIASGAVSTELDFEAIDAYLALGFVPTPRTPLADVSKLPPGMRLTADADGARLDRYWQLPAPAPAASPLSMEEYARQLLETLEDAVRLTLRGSDRPGVVLSGGLDSSLTVGLMARNTEHTVKTYTVAFAEAGKFSELEGARAVSDAFGTEHHELVLSVRDVEFDPERLIWHLDEPLADLSSLGLLELCRLASGEIDAAFSGQGSDQLFAGYTKHCAAGLAGQVRRIPGAATAARLLPAALLPGDLDRAAEMVAAPDPASRLLIAMRKLGPELRRELVRGPLAELDGDAGERAIRAHLNGLGESDALGAALYLDLKLELLDDLLHYFDRMSMAHGLEIRVPFMDHGLVELSATIPSSLKARGLQTKRVLRLAARDILPEQVLVSRRKVGFFHPVVDTWFRGQLEGAVGQYLLGDDLRCGQFIDQARLREMVRRGAPEDTYSLFVVLVLELWLASYLPRALARAG